VFGSSTLQPVTLQFGGGEHLADIVVQLTAQAMTLCFLDLQHVIGQLLRLELYGLAGATHAITDAQQGEHINQRQRG
nr:hypothetical protein [Tanacetum cinerariifolium]